MALETLLPAIRSLHDLPGLVAALGHQPLWEEVPDESSGKHPARCVPVSVVGRTGELPWFAIESTAPGRDARMLAQRSNRRGRISLVLGLDSARRHLAVAVGWGGFPVLELDLGSPGAEALRSLGKLAAGDGGGYLAFASRAADALAAESVGSRFFREFRATLDRLAGGFPGPMHADDRHSLALLQLTRVLFLYFIQTKGWLAGRDHFLAEEVDECLRKGRRIHRDLLRPLFFGTLNRPGESRSRTAAAFGQVPFLNGGLFEPHPLERRCRADVPNQLWRDAFDRLFERFHFTVAERDGRDGVVAPDMLGRVFEGVMAPDARRASGTFYTPAALVGQVLEAAMVALLSERLKCSASEAERRFHDRDARTVRVLESITLLDPAVGSGAFLLGALELLARHEERALASVRKRDILARNLFGVDQSAAAVRLTELRLWLAVVADDPSERAEQVEPLPNLDCLIRQGDSLFDPVGQWLEELRVSAGLAGELSKLRSAVVMACGAEKRTLVRKLRIAEARAMTESLGAGEWRARAEIALCLQEARGCDLFGRRRGLDRELRDRLGRLRARLSAIRRARRRLVSDGQVPWFHYQSHFADVFVRGGFDLVVGNPPWLRSEEMPPSLRSRLAGRYRWWRSGGQGYGNGPDLAIAFLERGLELAAPGGITAMLVPAKIVSARYGATARHGLAGGTTLHVVADLTGSPGAEFDATVYPMAIVASKSAPPPRHRVRATLAAAEERGVRQAALQGGGPWILRERLHSALEAVEGDHPKLGERFTCHLGLKTGANRIFLDPPAGLEPEILRWAIRGRDLAPFSYRARVRLIWTHDRQGNPRKELPDRCAAYLRSYHTELRARKDFAGGPPWTVFRARPAIATHRVIWADLARCLTAVSLSAERDLHCIPMNSCYVVPARSEAEAERLAAWLNSTWMRAAARLRAVPAAGGFARFNGQTVSALPLPLSACTDPDLIRLARAGRLGRAVQDELDEVAARHLAIPNASQSVLRGVVDGGAGHRR